MASRHIQLRSLLDIKPVKKHLRNISGFLVLSMFLHFLVSIVQTGIEQQKSVKTGKQNHCGSMKTRTSGASASWSHGRNKLKQKLKHERVWQNSGILVGQMCCRHVTCSWGRPHDVTSTFQSTELYEDDAPLFSCLSWLVNHLIPRSGDVWKLPLGLLCLKLEHSKNPEELRPDPPD